MHSEVKFKVSAERDFKTLVSFTNDSKCDNGRNLQWAIFKPYPALRKYFEGKESYQIKNKAVLKDFVRTKYTEAQSRMELSMARHKNQWDQIAPYYFKLVDELFNNRPWPDANYIAYGTIWGMYPRFLDEKIFQIPYKHRLPRYVNVVIAHEMLHFMFYDYLYKCYPKLKPLKYNFLCWHVSEIFNTLIQNSNKWLKVFEVKSMGYPEHSRTVALLRKKYRDNIISSNLDDLIKDIIIIVKKEII